MADENDVWGVGHDADLLPDVQFIAADLCAAFLRDPAPEITIKHVAAMVSASRAPVIPLTGRRRRRVAVAGAVAGVGIVLTGGLAAAGVLPTAMQDGVATLVRPIGIDIEHSGDQGRSGDQGDQGGEHEGTSTDGQSPTEQDPTAPVVGAGQGSSTTVAGSDANPSVTAPSQTGDLPAPATSAPGQSGSDPGRSATAPGHTGEGGNNKPDVPPGQVDNPGKGNKHATTTTTTPS